VYRVKTARAKTLHRC